MGGEGKVGEGEKRDEEVERECCSHCGWVIEDSGNEVRRGEYGGVKH